MKVSWWNRTRAAGLITLELPTVPNVLYAESAIS